MGSWREQFALSPASILLMTLLFVVLAQGTAVYFLIHQPWTGLQLEPDRESGFVRITSIFENSPASSEFQPGQILTAIASEHDEIPLLALVKTEPSEITARSTHDTFLELQGRLSNVIESSKPVTYTTLHNKQITLTPLSRTPFGSIPSTFWWIFVIGLVGLVSGVLAWTYRPNILGAKLLLGAALSSYIFHLSFAVILARELSFTAEIMEKLAFSELVFAHIYVIFLFSILSCYPNKLLSNKLLSIYICAFFLLVVGYGFRWVEIPIHQFYFPFMPPYLISIWLSYKQWKNSSLKPLDRAAVLVMQLSIIVPAGLAILLYIVPLMIDQQPAINAVAMRFVEVSIFIGCSIAILRFRLFEVEYWWFKSWLWLLGGVAVILLDMALIWLLNTPQIYALGLSMLLAGFLYFPLRQWLLGKLIPMDMQSLQDFLPRFSVAMSQAGSPLEFERGWQAALQARFAPLHIDQKAGELQEPALSENGLHLQVPALNKGRIYQLSGKQMASRLFGKTDIQTVESLLEIARMAFNASETRQQAVLAERERLLHEMRHTIGKRLQTLAEELPKPHQRAAAKETLQTLDETVCLSLPSASLQLRDHLAKWETETRQRAQAAGTSLNWRADRRLADKELSPRQALELMQFVREAVSNALKHANPTYLLVDFTRRDEHIHIQISHDGDIKPPETWCAGTGLRSMEARINALNGEWNIQPLPDQQGISINAKVPL